MSRTRFFQKIQHFLGLATATFQDVYIAERQLAIDETLIKFKGKVHFRQLIPITPARFGIKAFTLAESTSGHVLNSKIYSCKENNEVQKDLGRKAVLSVLQPNLDKGFYVFRDNYYTSVTLFEEKKKEEPLHVSHFGLTGKPCQERFVV